MCREELLHLSQDNEPEILIPSVMYAEQRAHELLTIGTFALAALMPFERKRRMKVAQASPRPQKYVK